MVTTGNAHCEHASVYQGCDQPARCDCAYRGPAREIQPGDVEYNDNTVVIVLNLGQRVVGIVVDGVSDVLSLTADQIRPAPEFAVTLSTEYLTGLGALGERMLILVNIEKLLNSEEMALLDIAANHVA